MFTSGDPRRSRLIVDNQSSRDDDIVLLRALNWNATAGRVYRVEVPSLASEADREQQFEPRTHVDSAAELRCCDASMYLRVSSSVLQYATSFVKSVSEAAG